jgi:hypothetical protein
MSLFKWIQDAVDSIIGQIMQQVNLVQNLVTAPLRAMINAVLGGIWKGDGATRFVQEMTSSVIPSLTNLMSSQTGYANALKKAQEAMAQAVKQATSIASGLNDVFNAIF